MTDTPELIERLIELRDRGPWTLADSDTVSDAVSTLQAQKRTLARVREWAELPPTKYDAYLRDGHKAAARAVLGILDGEGEG